jgi:serine/threonine protein kinase
VPRQGLPLAEFLDLGVQLVRAIAAAHRANILHRDLKPANVMITASGRVKVLDFGLAKVVGAGAQQDAETLMLTQPGTLMGTVPYMSPEQLQGREVDPFEAGRKVASSIAGARFLPMEGDNHWLLLRDPGVEAYAEAIERFLSEPGGGRGSSSGSSVR